MGDGCTRERHAVLGAHGTIAEEGIHLRQQVTRRVVHAWVRRPDLCQVQPREVAGTVEHAVALEGRHRDTGCQAAEHGDRSHGSLESREKSKSKDRTAIYQKRQLSLSPPPPLHGLHEGRVTHSHAAVKCVSHGYCQYPKYAL
eukprot:scaffold38796_cov65-Phaeocystis_antarctica.AAC.1